MLSHLSPMESSFPLGATTMTAWLQCDPDHRTLYGYTDVWMICQADGTWNVSMEQLSCGGKYSKFPYLI